MGAVAITDHDTLDGCRNASSLAGSQPFEFVVGVELSCAGKGRGEIHMLGYFLDLDNADLNEHMERFRDVREERARQIHEKLGTLGYKVDFELIKAEAGRAAIARPHIARVLQEMGIVSSYNEAFARFLGEGSPACAPKEEFPPEEAIKLIKGAGGVAVIAHPGLGVETRDIWNLKKAGAEGLEVYHPIHSDKQKKYYYAVARQYGMIPTGGSDYHGSKDYESGILGKIGVYKTVVRQLRDRANAS